MNGKRIKLMTIALLLVLSAVSQGRIKLVALPERAATVIRLDNPQATLIEEERVLTLQKGLNKVDFSWNGVFIDADSIRLKVLDHPDNVTLLSVSYPPNEAALVWDISSDGDYAETVRISYLLSNIDRLITYKAIADKAETFVDLKSYLVLRNFSGEDFDEARVLRDRLKKVDQKRLVTISYVRDPSKEDVRAYLFDVQVDFLFFSCSRAPPHRLFFREPVPRPVRDRDQEEHYRNLLQNPDDSGEGRPGGEPEERDRDRDRELEEVAGPYHARGRRDVVCEPKNPRRPVGEPEDKERLHRERDADEQYV